MGVQNSTSCSTAAGTPAYVCTAPCQAFGFAFQDTRPDECTSLPSSLNIQVLVVQNCNTADAHAQASLNSHLLSSNAYLDLGPADCACTPPATDRIANIYTADLQTGAYNTRGSNTITFSSYEAGSGPEPIGFRQFGSGGTFAVIIVYG